MLHKDFYRLANGFQIQCRDVPFGADDAVAIAPLILEFTNHGSQPKTNSKINIIFAN